MPESHEFGREERLPSYFMNRIQDFLSAARTDLRITLKDPTHVEVIPAEPYGISAIDLQGLWRFRDTAVSRAHPGGAAGVYVVWAVGTKQKIVEAPKPFTDETDYAFDLRITGGANPAGAGVEVFEKIAEVDWDGVAIVGLRQTYNAVTPPMLESGVMDGSGDLDWTRLPGGGFVPQLKADSVDTEAIAALAVTATEVAVEAIIESKIAANAVTTAKILNLAISTAKIAALAVTEEKLAGEAVSAAKIAALAVTSAKIAAEAVTEAKIGPLAVSTAKIAALAVTEGKIADKAVTSRKISLTHGALPISVETNLKESNQGVWVDLPGMSVTLETPYASRVVFEGYYATDMFMSNLRRNLTLLTIDANGVKLAQPGFGCGSPAFGEIPINYLRPLVSYRWEYNMAANVSTKFKAQGLIVTGTAGAEKGTIFVGGTFLNYEVFAQ